MAESSIIQSNNYLEKANVSHSFATYQSWQKSGGTSAYDSLILGSRCILTPGVDQSARNVVTDITNKWRFGLCSIDKRLGGVNPELSWEFDGAYKVVENNVVKHTSSRTPGIGNELRTQVYDSGGGVYTAKYYWRELGGESGTDEELEYTSDIPSATLLSYFPLFLKGEIYHVGGQLANLQIEKSGEDDTLDIFSYEADIPIIDFQLPLIFEAIPEGGNKDLPNHTLIYKGETLNNAQNGLIVFRAMKDWTNIKSVKLSVLPENTINSSREFNLRKNGTNVFESNPAIPANTEKVVSTQNIACVEDDVFILDYKSNGKQLKSPLFLELEIE